MIGKRDQNFSTAMSTFKGQTRKLIRRLGCKRTMPIFDPHDSASENETQDKGYNV